MRHRIATLLLAPAVLLVGAGTAQAFEECESDSDCTQGFSCGELEQGDCPAIDCAPGDEDCDPSPCEGELIHVCLPGPCGSDADCGEGLACLEVTYGECPPWPACPPDSEDCPEPTPEELECTETTESLCLPAYVAPCAADADCGEGFVCERPELCTCTNDEPVPGDGDGDGDDDDPRDPEPDCECHPSGEAICLPVEVECEDDSACSEGWSCETLGGTSRLCEYDPETGEERCEEPEEDENGLCMPPHWGMGWWDDGGVALEAATGDESARVNTPQRALEEADGGCSAAPGAASGGAVALLWTLPLLLGRLRRRP